MEQADYTKPIKVQYGADSILFHIRPGFYAIDLLLEDKLVTVLGFSPFNSKVLRNGVQLGVLADLIPGETLVIETAVNTKGLGTPKEHKCEKWRRKNGFGKETAKGDHWRWLIGKESVQVNYKNGDLDIASLKAIAKILNRSARDLTQEIRAI